MSRLTHCVTCPYWQGCTAIRRHVDFGDKPLVSLPFPDQPRINTTYHVFEKSATEGPTRSMLGHRPIVDGEAQPYVFETYAEVFGQVKVLGAALAGLGLGPGSPVSILAINRPEWIKTLLALWSQSMVCVPLYDTLGASSVEFIINDAEVGVIFLANNKLDRVLEVANACPTLRTIVQFEPVTEEMEKLVATQASNVKIISFQTLLQGNGAAEAAKPRPPSPEELAYIMVGRMPLPNVLVCTSNLCIFIFNCFLCYLHSLSSI